MLQQVFTRFLSQYAVRYFSRADDLYNYRLSADEMAGQSAAPVSEPDLILLDLNMPGMGDYQTLLSLKRHPQWQQIPVVMVSNTGSVEEGEQCYKGSANSFLNKPSDFLPLKQMIETPGLVSRY